MYTFLLLAWVATAAALLAPFRLHRRSRAKLGDGHWVSTLVTLGVVLMVMAWSLVPLFFQRDGLFSPAAFSALGIYGLLAVMAMRMLGPSGDAALLLDRFPKAATAAAAATYNDDQSEIEL